MDRDQVLQFLRENANSTAREIARAVSTASASVTKSEVNAFLYRALDEGLVIVEDTGPPRWSVSVESKPEPVTEPAWIVREYLSLSGESWSDAQLNAALVSPRVEALAIFTEVELRKALQRCGVELLTWDAWIDSAAAVRSETIKL